MSQSILVEETVSVDKWEDPEVFIEVHYDTEFAYITMESPAEAIDLAIPLDHVKRVAAALGLAHDLARDESYIEVDCG